MSTRNVEITYFSKMEDDNTGTALKLAKKRAEELRIRNVVVASTVGETGAQASEIFKGYNLIVVSHSYGFSKPNTQEMTEENQRKITANGGKLLTTTHIFGGIGRAARRKYNTMQIDEIIANTLRLFGQGMKVVCEVAIMAADAGLLRTDEDAVVVGGTGRGADTVVILRPANAQDFFDLRVKEIVCKPGF